MRHLSIVESTLPPFTRRIACRLCRTLIEVMEWPPGHIDDETYVCGECLLDPEPRVEPDAAS